MMTHPLTRLVFVLITCMFDLHGCSASPKLLDFNAVETADERRAVSEFYRKEAIMFRQKADELAERVIAYRPLFGEESDWVTGARLLVEYYQQEARDRQRLADQYDSSSGGPLSAPSRPEGGASLK
jgi:hypothetical protein